MDNKDNNIEELEEQESENIDSNDSNDVDDSYIDDEQQQYYGQSVPINNNYPIHAKSPSALQGKHRNLNPNNDNLARGINPNKNNQNHNNNNKNDDTKKNLNTKENNKNRNPIPGIINKVNRKNKNANNKENNSNNNKGGLNKKENDSNQESSKNPFKKQDNELKQAESQSEGAQLFNKIKKIAKRFVKFLIFLGPIGIIIFIVLLLIILIVVILGGGSEAYGSSCSSEATEQDLLNFINTFEGSGGYCDESTKTEYLAYQNPNDRVTIGHGVTSDYIPGLEVGDCISVEEVDSYQLQAIESKREFIKGVFAGVSLTNYQEDALTSMAYNGCANFFSKMKTAYEEDGYEGLWREMKGCTSGLDGLKRRRKAEFDLFVTGDYTVAAEYKTKTFENGEYDDYNSEDVMSRKDSVKTTCTSFNGEFIYPAAEFYPVSGELGCFGWRIHPTVGGGRHHDGVDLAMPEGTEVLASASGEVTYVSTDPQAFQNCGACISYGAYIIIKHDDDYTTKYAHLSEILVSAGDTISQGQIIGKSGNSGGSTGPHLHFEINEKTTPIDPAQFIDLRGACD